VTVIRVDPAVLEDHASRIEDRAESLRAIGREAYRATQFAPSYDGQFGAQVQAIGAEAWSRMSAQADRLEDLTERLRAKACEFAAADQLSVAMPPGPWLDWDSFPWWLELAIGLFPGGDLLDIGKQLETFLQGEDVDELVLILAIVGLVADLGWLEPSPASEVPNAGLAALKLVFKAIPAAPCASKATGEGHGYVQGALENGGVYFNTPPGLYTDALKRNRPIMEEINQEFLRRQMRSGVDRIELVGESIDDVLLNRPDSFAALELRLLQREAPGLGYHLEGEIWVFGGK